MAEASLWWRAVRPFSFTVSVVPPIMGAVIAAMENTVLHFHWPHFSLTLVGCMLAHAGANMLSDYCDFRAGVDRPGTYGSSGVLVEGVMRPEELLWGAVVAYVGAALVGAYLVWATPKGVFLLGLILIGGVFGVFYTAGPFPLKYRALGDLAVFVSFGSAMTLGAYFVQAHRFSWSPVVYALPVAMLVDAILHSNNLRDVQNDDVVNIRTLPIILGERGARLMYHALVLGAFVLVPVLVAFAALPWISLITLASLPLALRLIRMVRDKGRIPDGQFAMIDALTAKLHSAFGMLFILSLLLHHFVLGQDL